MTKFSAVGAGEWKADAACIGETDDILFGPVAVQHAAAQRLCAGCPVLNECRQEAKVEAYGLWGGWHEGHPSRPKIGRQRPSHERKEAPVPACRCQVCCEVRDEQAAERKTLREQAKRDRVDPAAIQLVETVCDRHGVTYQEVLGRGLETHVVAARQESMFLLRASGMAFAAIGRMLGRHHTTCIHGVRRYLEKAAA